MAREDRSVLEAVGGHLDVIQGEFEDEVALPVPLDGGLKAKDRLSVNCQVDSPYW